MKHVLLAFVGALYPIIATANEPQLYMSSGCYDQSAMRDVVQLSEEDGMLMMFQYISDGRCGPVVYSQEQWNQGSDIRDTGVRVLYAHPFNWARSETINPADLPAEVVMYFDTSSELE